MFVSKALVNRGLCFCSLPDNDYFCRMKYWEFIHQNAGADVMSLSLAYGSRKSSLDFDFQDAVMQIEARRKSARKIPWFIAHDRFRFPSLQASEQASNQAVALYHATLIGRDKHIADLTAGLGIDAMAVALYGNRVDAFEMDGHRAEVLMKNAGELQLSDFKVHAADSIKYLADNPELHYDCIFIDPARRDSAGHRIFRLQDSIPNVIDNMDMLLRHAPKVLVKASPLLDITQTLRDIDIPGRGMTIEIVSYRGEVKEVLIHVSKTGEHKGIAVVDIADAVDFPAGEVVLNYRYSASMPGDGDIRLAGMDDLVSGRYLYEAGAGMRKLHCAPLICGTYADIKALSREGELFVSDNLYADFPGRVGIITSVINGKEARGMHGERIRVVSSHYPLSPDELRKKYKFSEGDAVSLYATSLNGGKKVLILTENV